MIVRIWYLICLLSFTLADPAMAESDYDWAVKNLFNPSFSNMLSNANRFSVNHADFSAAKACRQDPRCGAPGQKRSGYKLATGKCCSGSSACLEEFEAYRVKIDKVLYNLYKNDRLQAYVRQDQAARISAVKSAAAGNAKANAIMERRLDRLAKGEQSYQESFKTRADANIKQLNEHLMALGSSVDKYCRKAGWYQRNGLQLYRHARVKFSN